jgi:hypothetical protein
VETLVIHIQIAKMMIVIYYLYNVTNVQKKCKDVVLLNVRKLQLYLLKSKYNFRLLVDDAHGFGTMGATGAGVGEEQGCQDDIDVYFCAFSGNDGDAQCNGRKNDPYSRSDVIIGQTHGAHDG